MKILFLILTFTAFSQSIECDIDGCNFPANVLIHNEIENDSLRKYELDLENNMSITKTSNLSNKDLGIAFDSESLYSFSINFSSDIEEDTSNFYLMGNQVNTLSINLNGHNGSDAINAGLVCRDKFISGSLGSDAKDFFENRRLLDSSIPDSCTIEDINYLDDDFSCDIGEENLSGSITAQRWDSKINCRGSVVQNMCLEREVKIGCYWLAEGDGGNCCSAESVVYPPGSGWSCNQSFCSEINDHSGLYKYFEIEVYESEYNNLKNTMNDENICNNYFPRSDTSDGSFSVSVSKGDIYCYKPSGSLFPGVKTDFCSEPLSYQEYNVTASNWNLIAIEYKDASVGSYVESGQSGAYLCSRNGGTLECRKDTTNCGYTSRNIGGNTVYGYVCSEGNSRLDVRYKYYNSNGFSYYRYRTYL